MIDRPNTVVADETLVTEITLQPDGRVYVFGASREVLAILAELRPNDARLLARLASTGCPERTSDSPP